MDFTGPASHLTMSYRSDPPLPSSDIIKLARARTDLEKQRRLSRQLQAATPQTGATTLLSEAVSSQLGGRIQRLFGISHFSVDPSYLATTTVGQNPAARVTVQQQFARNLIITYSTDVTSTQQQVIQIEYTVRPDVSVEKAAAMRTGRSASTWFSKRLQGSCAGSAAIQGVQGMPLG